MNDSSHLSVHLPATRAVTFGRLFEAVSVTLETRSGPMTPADFVKSLLAVRTLHMARDQACIRRSLDRIDESMKLLDRPVDGAPSTGASGGAVACSVAVVSRSQWVLYFVVELVALSPLLSTTKALSLARSLHGIARHVAPEYAAASMDSGLRRSRVH